MSDEWEIRDGGPIHYHDTPGFAPHWTFTDISVEGFTIEERSMNRTEEAKLWAEIKLAANQAADAGEKPAYAIVHPDTFYWLCIEQGYGPAHTNALLERGHIECQYAYRPRGAQYAQSEKLRVVPAPAGSALADELERDEALICDSATAFVKGVVDEPGEA